MARIGVLEDDPALAELYQTVLRQAGHECCCFGTVREFLAALGREKFDLLLVDWILPDGKGDTVLTWVRTNIGWDIPIMVSSALGKEEQIETALQLGADDYVTKPLGWREVTARIAALTRRKAGPEGHTRITMPPYLLDISDNSICINGVPVEVTQKEFDLACYFFRNPGKLISRVRLLDNVWGIGADIDTRTVDAHVSRLRKKLALAPENGWVIASTYGQGYRLEKFAPA